MATEARPTPIMMSVFVWVLAEAEDLEFGFEVGEANSDVASVVGLIGLASVADCVEEILEE